MKTNPKPRRMPPLVSLLGPSGSGKTMLAEALVARWTRAGFRVGYVKHASHGFEMDRPGKDTDRVAAAGAAGVAVTGPGGFAYVERGDPRDPRDVVRRHFADRDVVVLEGFRSHGFPAVVIAGDEDPRAALAEARGAVVALVVREATAEVTRAARTARVFEAGEMEGLAAHVERVIGLRAPGGTPRALAPRPLTRGSRRGP